MIYVTSSSTSIITTRTPVDGIVNWWRYVVIRPAHHGARRTHGPAARTPHRRLRRSRASALRLNAALRSGRGRTSHRPPGLHTEGRSDPRGAEPGSPVRRPRSQVHGRGGFGAGS